LGDTLVTVFSQFICPREQPRAAHRITPRNLFDIALGSDNLWKTDTYSLDGKITVVNLMKKDASAISCPAFPERIPSRRAPSSPNSRSISNRLARVCRPNLGFSVTR